jgi:hypothetical protein
MVALKYLDLSFGHVHIQEFPMHLLMLKKLLLPFNKMKTKGLIEYKNMMTKLV